MPLTCGGINILSIGLKKNAILSIIRSSENGLVKYIKAIFYKSFRCGNLSFHKKFPHLKLIQNLSKFFFFLEKLSNSMY